jgi:hypothetical protein
MVSAMEYSTLAHSLIFKVFVEMSHDTMGHSVSSLSQLQSTTVEKRKNTTADNKNNAAKKEEGQVRYHTRHQIQ